MVYAQCKKGVVAFEGQKKTKKDFACVEVWTHDLKGKALQSDALASVATADL